MRINIERDTRCEGHALVGGTSNGLTHSAADGLIVHRFTPVSHEKGITDRLSTTVQSTSGTSAAT